MAADDGEAVLADVVAGARETFGDERLLAVYAMGSLAHGGFSPLVSDVDTALILTDPLTSSDAASVEQLAERVRALGSDLHARVSVFWGSPDSLRAGSGAGRFPPLDRLCLFEHGRLLYGDEVRDGLTPPSRADLTVAGARFALDLLTDQVVAGAADPALLVAGGVRAMTKVVLFPVRFLFTADTGLEGTNHAAVERYSAQHRGPAAELVAAAFRWRTDPPDDAAATELLRRGFVTLYDDYLSDHIGRLESLGAPRLAEGFVRWRDRLRAAAG
ncbi:hypothetical protein [Mycolicibacillus trivialis]|nr:hypothetical protein [Mycolicibacillus trivialis]